MTLSRLNVFSQVLCSTRKRRVLCLRVRPCVFGLRVRAPLRLRVRLPFVLRFHVRYKLSTLYVFETCSESVGFCGLSYLERACFFDPGAPSPWTPRKSLHKQDARPKRPARTQNIVDEQVFKRLSFCCTFSFLEFGLKMNVCVSCSFPSFYALKGWMGASKTIKQKRPKTLPGDSIKTRLGGCRVKHSACAQ